MQIIRNILSIPGRIFGFFRSIIRELKNTEFPTRKRTLRMSNIIIIVSIAISVLLLAFDTVFTFLRGLLTGASN